MIHTVGPVWRGGEGGEPELLASCYRACFSLADAHGLRTIAFPAISTGVYGYPIPQAAAIAIAETMRYLQAGGGLEQVRFVCFNAENEAAYHKALASL